MLIRTKWSKCSRFYSFRLVMNYIPSTHKSRLYLKNLLQLLSDLERINASLLMKGSFWYASVVNTLAFSQLCTVKISKMLGHSSSNQRHLKENKTKRAIIHCRIIPRQMTKILKKLELGLWVYPVQIYFLQLKNVIKRKWSLWTDTYFDWEAGFIMKIFVIQLKLCNLLGQRISL